MAVHLELENDEALLLYYFLQREIDDENGARLKPLTNHIGELWALNALNGLLERRLVEPLRPDYDTLLNDANASILKRCGSWPD